MENNLTKELTTTLSPCYEMLIITENIRIELDSQQESDAENPLTATNLFSIFTADIIKEEVVFTR